MDWAAALRGQIRERARALLESAPAVGYESLGDPPTVLFLPSADESVHGNFFPEAWRAIRGNAEWRRRLEKPHSQFRALPPEHAKGAKELDSSNSSDALLMNCFCAPGGAAAGAVVLGSSPRNALPIFGWHPGVRLSHGSPDDTEVDMRLGDTLVEAKLTEKDFTERPKEHVFRYRDLKAAFDIDLLPSRDLHFLGYQLIRNVLAAAQHSLRLVVLIDYRRPDLLNEWWRVHSAIRSGVLRARCGVRFWQQVAREMPARLAEFLATKYGL